ncbi:rhomboid family intramembrane serine protease [Desulfosporosinus sp.]|uniref:rhomboid family intramembrane serine protease n=1 Tax=Desulfosporosinus sp. TaxID=157907 RepID=UPI0025C62B28|nr:rhomboid family intramembrane serine protease [Desulfosporosinus sp.]MBC2725641.1 rhomboid family intramembrane serine protease [Desulfosporosinus sp.]
MAQNIIAKIQKNLFSSPATNILISLNVLVFIIINVFPNSSKILLLDPQNLTEIPWTLISVFFSHIILIHLLANIGLLFVFGVELEKVVDARNVFFIYALTGFLGSITIVPYADIIQWTGPVAGASAATFGITAAFAAISPNKIVLKGKVKHWVISLFIVNIIVTLLNPQVSVAAPAHALGIISGFISGLWIKGRILRRND